MKPYRFMAEQPSHETPPAGLAPGSLPTFLIGGVRKSATTSLWSYLSLHPDIGMGYMKEPQFFSRQAGRADTGDDFGPPRTGTFVRGWNWYAAQFKGTEHLPARGEASTMYFDAPDSAELLAATLPDIKMVFCLRHPVDRIYSHYWYERQSEQLPEFAEMIVRGHRRLDWYVHQSHYAEHLARFSQHLSKSQVHVVLASDLAEAPESSVRSVCEFIGVDPDRISHEKIPSRNRASRPRSLSLQRLLTQHRGEWTRFVPMSMRSSTLAGKEWVLARNARPFKYSPMDAQIRGELVDQFAPDVDAVEELLGRDLSAWRR